MAYFETLLGPVLTSVARISSMRLCLDVKAVGRRCLSNERNIALQTVHGRKGTEHVTQIEQDPGMYATTSERGEE